MVIIKILSTNYGAPSYFIGCPSTGKFININANGARKVSKVCNSDIRIATQDVFDTIRNRSKEIKRIRKEDIICLAKEN